jgi:putative ABC transport system permease protein
MAFSAKRALAESAAEARSHPVTSVLLLLVSLAMTASTLLTVGRSAAAERDILDGLDAAGTRLITVLALDGSPGLSAPELSIIGDLPEVDWVLGLGPAEDVRSGPTGERVNVAARSLVTDVPPLVAIDLGRSPSPGEAVTSVRAQRGLRLKQPAGWITVADQPYAVVGSFAVGGVIADLERLVLTHSPGEAPNATLVYVMVHDAQDVPVVAERTRLLSGSAPDLLSIRTSEQLLAADQVISGEVGALSRQIALGVVVLGLFLVLLTVSLALAGRRSDMGRRRALGSSRSALAALVLLTVTMPTLAGAVLGTVVGLGATAVTGGSMPDVLFVVAVNLLTLSTVALATLPPALNVALQDPVAVLRVP